MKSPRPQAWRQGNVLAVRGATWEFKPGVTRDTFADEYVKNPTHAERDYGALPPRSVQSALHDTAIVEKAHNPDRQSPVNEDGSFKSWFMGSAEFEYYIHIDMSKERDNTGIGLCHYDMVNDDYVVDLVQTIKRADDWKLSFERIYHLIETLDKLGFKFKIVSFDSWQSYQMIEKLTNRGFNAQLYSVDRGTEAYDTLIEMLLTGKLNYYFQATFVKELKELKLYRGQRYDHPPGGSKDTSDGVAGAIAQCVKDRVGLSLMGDEVDRCVKQCETFAFDMIEDNQSIWFALTTNTVPGALKNRVRVARIDVVEDRLIFLFGWHDRANKQLTTEVYQVWENFSSESWTKFTEMLTGLMNICSIPSFSVNEYVPIDIITFLQDCGRKVSTSIYARSSGRRQGKMARATNIIESNIRVMVSQIKKQNLFFPEAQPLVKDLKFMTEDNMRQRVFAKALAGWTDFALREVAYGQMGAGMPSPVSAGPAPINAIASRDRPSRMNPVGKNMLGARRARSGDITLDVVRARYADKMSTGQGSQSASGDQKKGPRSLPKPIRATRPR